MKPVSAAVKLITLSSSSASNAAPLFANSDGNIYTFGTTNYTARPNTYTGAFHVFRIRSVDITSLLLYIDGTYPGGGSTAPLARTGNFNEIGSDSTTGIFGDGDIAEILHYGVTLNPTQCADLEKYLGTKYGITVAGGGSVVDPAAVSGLVGWWKADAIT
jgi:hypothetical protein